MTLINQLSLPAEGGCLCGQLRYRIDHPPFAADYCHCRHCQKSTGSVAGAWMDFKVTEVTWLQGEVTEYASSEYVRRGFCAACGASVSFRDTRYPDYYTIAITTLDEPNTVQPTYHIYTQSQLQWLTIKDECPRYQQGQTKD
ncbi:GFA family protein [Shewanella maritima]|uniref:GFA family protein n=1 Tax=Shewanella maritima TaxID=2520507 RepID=UPI003736A923